MYRSLKILLYVTVAVCPLMEAQAGEAAPHPPRRPLPVEAHIDGYTKLGSDRRLTGIEAFAPLSWDGQILTFTDLRFVGDDADGREFNAGIGARRVSDDGSYILGGYGFFDRRRSPTGALYSQLTAGTEILTQNWDFRFNGYIPLSQAQVIARDSVALPSTLSLSGTGLVASGGRATSEAIEHPMAGLDFEIGRKLPFLDATWFSDTRAYAGAFHFDAEDVRPMDGFRFRIETAPLSWLRFGAEHQQDNIRGETDFVEARIRIPLDFWKRDRESQADKARPEGILARLDTRVSRDVDIVTEGRTKTQIERAQNVPVLNATTGVAQKIYVVDNEAAGGGDGSMDTPFNTLAAAQGAAGAHDIIYVRHGDGTSTGMNAGVNLNQAGQKLIGSGVDLTFDTADMQVSGIPGGITNGAVIAAATAAPLITNAGGNGISITADDVEVAGLTVSGTSNNGIYAYNARDITIRDVTSSGNANDGIRIEASGAGVSMTGVSIQDATTTSNRNGLRLYAQNDASLAAKVESSAATSNSQHGMIVYDDSTAGSVDADLGGGDQGSAGLNILTGNTLEDLTLDTDGATLSAQNNWWGQPGGPDIDDPSDGKASQIYYGAPLDTGLVGNWTFDTAWTTNSTAYDRSGNNNTGTLTNGPTATTGQLGGALSFDGADDFISIGNSSTLQPLIGGWSVSFWLKRTGIGGGDYPQIIGSRPWVVGLDKGWAISVGGTAETGKISSHFADGGTGWDVTDNKSTSVSVLNTWEHWVVVINRAGSNISYYKNNVLDVLRAPPFPAGSINQTDSIYIGREIGGSNSRKVNGLIDDVRIYNRALSASEIAELYRMNTTGIASTTGALSSAP